MKRKTIREIKLMNNSNLLDEFMRVRGQEDQEYYYELRNEILERMEEGS